LRGIARPQYRLRVEEIRVFYDVSGSTVEVLALSILHKQAGTWLLVRDANLFAPVS